MILNFQQKECFDNIVSFLSSPKHQIFILKGYAGTGKTTMIEFITNYLDSEKKNYHLMAPTGRAAKVLSSKLTRKKAFTIHKSIYEFDKVKIDEENNELRFVFPIKSHDKIAVCIVDESSMISSLKVDSDLYQFGTGNLLEDLLNFANLYQGGKIIFIGDPMQLPPVNDNQSNALNEAYFENLNLTVRSFLLTDIIRQEKESAILQNSMAIRSLYLNDERNEFKLIKQEGEVETIAINDVVDSYIKSSDNSAIICYSNNQVSIYNKEIRKKLFPDRDSISVGDKLMIVRNMYLNECELMNGDMVTVVDVCDDTVTQSAPVWKVIDREKRKITVNLVFRRVTIKTEDGIKLSLYIIETLLENNNATLTVDEFKALYINTLMRIRQTHPQTSISDETMATLVAHDEFYNAAHVKYGYAFTCHKSQGGEWENVYVDFYKRTGLDNHTLRWKYTAITRASKRLWCSNLPDITPLSKLKITGIVKTTKVSSKALSFANIPDTPFHDATVPLGVKAKYWSIQDHLKDTYYKIIDVRSAHYRDSYILDSPFGKIRMDCIYNSAGLVTRYECSPMNNELISIFEQEDNIEFSINYVPSLPSLAALYHKLLSACDELDITITNIEEGNYKVTYYLRATGHYAALNFNYNAKGFISYVNPVSDLGEEDDKLNKMIDKLR